ncbi:MAG: hypothetical protein QNK37_07410 [Acidobacteriota bacterium]|nr:hypothetical protein [Acidobacteriota bacterium]
MLKKLKAMGLSVSMAGVLALGSFALLAPQKAQAASCAPICDFSCWCPGGKVCVTWWGTNCPNTRCNNICLF